MSSTQRIKQELTALVSLMLYFSVWLGFLMLLKVLVLADYQIVFSDVSRALVGALVLAKVVLILEHVEFGAWVRPRPAWVDVVLRTALYAFGVFVILLFEKAFEGRHEYGGFTASLNSVFQHTDFYHVWLNFLCLTGALLSYNILSVVRKNLGKGTLLRMFLTPLPEEPMLKNYISEDNKRKQ